MSLQSRPAILGLEQLPLARSSWEGLVLRIVDETPAGEPPAHAFAMPADQIGAGRPSVSIVGRTGFPGAVMLSLAVHAAVALWLLRHTEDDTIGAGGRELDSVSIEIVDARAIETVLPVARSDGGGTPSAPEDPGTGGDVSQAKIMAEIPRPALSLPTAPPEALVKPDEQESERPDLAAAEIQADKPRVAPADPRRLPDPIELPPPAPETKEPAPEDTADGRADNRREAQAAAVAGGPSARSAQAISSAEGAAAASAGALARYAVAVRMALGKVPPRHSGGRGRVVVSFVVEPDGEVRDARVTRSSGSEQLDNEALASVKRARFSPPPLEFSSLQRTFVVPFEFR